MGSRKLHFGPVNGGLSVPARRLPQGAPCADCTLHPRRAGDKQEPLRRLLGSNRGFPQGGALPTAQVQTE